VGFVPYAKPKLVPDAQSSGHFLVPGMSAGPSDMHRTIMLDDRDGVVVTPPLDAI
jgi:hypothetical protein